MEIILLCGNDPDIYKLIMGDINMVGKIVVKVNTSGMKERLIDRFRLSKIDTSMDIYSNNTTKFGFAKIDNYTKLPDIINEFKSLCAE